MRKQAGEAVNGGRLLGSRGARVGLENEKKEMSRKPVDRRVSIVYAVKVAG